jgi:poly(A) polymerase
VTPIQTRVLMDAAARSRLTSLSEHLSARGVEVHLVGGAVRDTLVGRTVDDFDIVVPPGGMRAVESWAGVQDRYAVPLHEDPPTRRVTFDDGMVLDACCYRGPSLDADLRRRDFTVNAIAARLSDALGDLSGRLIDPCGGVEDLRRRILRRGFDDSLTDDPLRMLRAFRFMATHGLRIEESALAIIRRDPANVTSVAWERIRDEFFKMLAAPRAYPALRGMEASGMLGVLLPEIAQMKGAPQNQFHHLDVWEHTLDALDRFERAPVPPCLSSLHGEFAAYLAEPRGQGIPTVALLKFALLLHDVAKPATRTVGDDGRVRFLGHEKDGAEITNLVGRRFRLSNRGREAASLLVAQHLRTMHLSSGGPPSPRALRRFLRRVRSDWMGVVAHSWADMEASRGPARTQAQRGRTERTLVAIADFWHEEARTIVPQKPLIQGGEIIRRFGVPPGREIGRLLRAVRDARDDGEIRTPAEARAYLGALLRKRKAERESR